MSVGNELSCVRFFCVYVFACTFLPEVVVNGNFLQTFVYYLLLKHFIIERLLFLALKHLCYDKNSLLENVDLLHQSMKHPVYSVHNCVFCGDWMFEASSF